MGKRRYNCGGWNHISSTYWHLHLELRPYPSWRSHRQDSENAYSTVRDVKQANVAEGHTLKTEEKPAALREHPFEFNMIMTEQLSVRDKFRSNLTDFLNDSPDAALVATQQLTAQRRWLLDSGASSHYIKEPHLQKRIFGFRPDFGGFRWILRIFWIFWISNPKSKLKDSPPVEWLQWILQPPKVTLLGFAASQINFARICSQPNKLYLDLQPAK